MAKKSLAQLCAIEKTVKNRTHTVCTDLHQSLGKSTLFEGQTANYQPKAEDGEQFPPENVPVQKSALKLLQGLMDESSHFWDVNAQRDHGNTTAFGHVKVDGQVIFEAPVTTLLFIEKQLTDLRTSIEKAPVLPAAENWSWDTKMEVWVGDLRKTEKTRKVQKPIELAPATDKHPAQVQLVQSDEVIGHWEKRKLHGALSESEKRTLADRVNVLLLAVKEAREKANEHQVDDVRISASIRQFLGL